MSTPPEAVLLPVGTSKLEEYITEIVTWVAQGRNNTWIADQLDTDETSIRRFKVRHGLKTPRPEDLEIVTGARSIEWGFGAAQPVPPSGNDYELVVVGSDMHFPYQEDRAIDGFVDLIRTVQPDRVVLNGDINDFFQLSRFNTGFERMDTLQDEIDQANRFRFRVRRAAPNAIIDETEGNHDNRLRTYVAHQARALQSLRALKPETLIPYSDLEINWHPGCGFLLREDFLVKHGTAYSSTPGGTARAELNLNGISGVSGHVHRYEQSQRNNYKDACWTVAGTMSRLDPDYIVGKPNWNQSVLILEISNLSGLVNVTNVPMFDGALRFACKAY